MSLPAALERAASALPSRADAIRPANGDPERLLRELEPAAATEVLAWLLEHETAAGEELAQAWAERAEGHAPLAALRPDTLPKPARKALRRALHRLRSRGVSIEAAEDTRVARLPELQDELKGAWLSAPDPSGAQLSVEVEPGPSGGVRLFQGAIDCERGVLEFQVLSANRSQARRWLRDLTQGARLAAVPVEPSSLAALVARAAEAHPADRALPQAFSEWRGRVASPPAGSRTPGELAREALGPAASPEPSQLRRVAAAVQAGEIGPWPPPLDELREWAEKIHKTADSRLLVDGNQRRVQVDAALADVLAVRYDGVRGERSAARFEELAHARWRAGRESEARDCLAAADAFRTQPPADNPVARALVERALEPVLAGLREQESDESSLLVKP